MDKPDEYPKQDHILSHNSILRGRYPSFHVVHRKIEIPIKYINVFHHRHNYGDGINGVLCYDPHGTGIFYFITQQNINKHVQLRYRD